MSRDAEVLALLNRHTEVEHQRLQPIWAHKVSGRQLRLLDDPVAEGVALRDVITDNSRPEDFALRSVLEDRRILAVLRSLSPAEAAVVAAYGSSPMTWTQAAVEAGVANPEAFGERVRRKVKRLGRRWSAHRSVGAQAAKVVIR